MGYQSHRFYRHDPRLQTKFRAYEGERNLVCNRPPDAFLNWGKRCRRGEAFGERRVLNSVVYPNASPWLEAKLEAKLAAKLAPIYAKAGVCMP